ncbi:hypothetical protein [Oceanobacillus kapialis]|uniref:Helix-turn-helix domain-containing protein n=1 Tax=Oceanobacillus kapialis TaxID=481353 RepID=A0ABW5PX89_9BACI
MTALFELRQFPELEIRPKKAIKRDQPRLLSGSEVVTIRKTYDRGDYTMRELAEHYGVAETLIGKIIRGEIYADAGGPINRVNIKHNRNGGYHKSRHVSPEIKTHNQTVNVFRFPILNDFRRFSWRMGQSVKFLFECLSIFHKFFPPLCNIVTDSSVRSREIEIL